MSMGEVSKEHCESEAAASLKSLLGYKKGLLKTASLKLPQFAKSLACPSPDNHTTLKPWGEVL